MVISRPPLAKESQMNQSIDSFLDQWTSAERAGDTEALDQTLLADEFYGIGPVGFILPKPAWLARHRTGELTYEAFDLNEVQTRLLGDVAVVAARNNTRGTYLGHPLPEAVRATIVLANNERVWRMAAIHMSFIAGTAGAPPVPGFGAAAGRQGAVA
jgi:hypothetical protein